MDSVTTAESKSEHSIEGLKNFFNGSLETYYKVETPFHDLQDSPWFIP